jgi:integrase
VATRREYGSGSVYRRASDGRWVGTIEAGYTATGARRRVTVVGKTEADAKRKLRDKRAELDRGRRAKVDRRKTVKAWADEWLELTQRNLSPKSWGTNAGQIRRWVIPTIGHVRLAEISHADLRAIAAAQRKAGQAASSIARCRAVTLKMLKDAITEGHPVPGEVVAVQPRAKRKGPKKDREGLAIGEALSVLQTAREHLPHHSRWDLAFLQGLRQGEALGLTWELVDLEAGLLTVSWQLQPLPYIDRRDKALGFRVPDDYEARRLDGGLHLVRPKTAAGERVIPLVPWAVETLSAWRDVAPDNAHGLVWSRLDGRPIDKHVDLEEWKGLQGAAEIGHPAGRYYHGHEIRNTTATLLTEAGVDPFIITAILGHTDIETSRIYVTRRAQQARPAMEAVAAALQLG